MSLCENPLEDLTRSDDGGDSGDGNTRSVRGTGGGGENNKNTGRKAGGRKGRMANKVKNKRRRTICTRTLVSRQKEKRKKSPKVSISTR